MHETSIAESVAELARDKVPPGAVLRAVTLEAGPMRGIEPDAMQWAWQAVVGEGVALRLRVLPWRIRCEDCGAESDVDDPLAPCDACRGERTRPLPSDALRVTAIDVDDEAPASNPRL